MPGGEVFPESPLLRACSGFVATARARLRFIYTRGYIFYTGGNSALGVLIYVYNCINARRRDVSVGIAIFFLENIAAVFMREDFLYAAR